MFDQPLDKDEIRAALPLGFVCSEVGVQIDVNGRGLCPFHDDHRPSFTLYTGGDNVERFSCPVCAVSGDAFDLIQRQEGISFSASVTRAAHILSSLPDAVAYNKRTAVYREFDGKAAHTFLSEGRERARENEGWLCVVLGLSAENRGVEHRYCLDDWLRRKWSLGIGPNGEVLFPHFDSDMKLTGIKCKGLDGKRWAFPGSTFNSLYGSWHIRQTRYLLLCEGETDTIWASQQGITSIDIYGLPRGAAAFSSEWTKAEADIYFLAFDGDEAGCLATDNWINALKGRDVRIVKVPVKQDLREWAPNLNVALKSATIVQ